jgi:hypothetical protein
MEETHVTYKNLFGSAIAIVLLIVYVYLVGSGVSAATCAPQPACGAGFNSQMAGAMALIGGLIAALVVAELGATKPGQMPGVRGFSVDISDRVRKTSQILTGSYLAVWVVAGLVAFLVGLKHPDALEPLTALGQSWLGIAVAAAYAYFGIDQ